MGRRISSSVQVLELTPQRQAARSNATNATIANRISTTPRT